MRGPLVRALGKIPGHPEFLQNRTSREPEQSFDAWLEAGMGLGGHRYGAGFTDAFELGGATGFVWRAPHLARTDDLLAGVLFPSCDTVGRHYPLAVVCAISARTVALAPHVIPLAFGDFLERVHEAAVDFPRLGKAELDARLSLLGPPTEDDVARAAAEYAEWCRTTPVDRAWRAIFPDRPAEMAHAAIADLRAAADGVRGVEAPRRGPMVRLPLGEAGPASATLWLDVIRRLCRWRHTVPSSFWAVDEGALFVALGEAEASALPALWLPEAREQAVFCPGSSPMAASSAGAFGPPLPGSVPPSGPPSLAPASAEPWGPVSRPFLPSGEANGDRGALMSDLLAALEG